MMTEAMSPAEKRKQNPEAHRPRLVLFRHVRGTSILDRIADGVNKFTEA
jgi:hypothetical protein